MWLQVFTSIGLEKFHIVGESLGSAYSGQYAADYPDMLHSITLLCPPSKQTVPLIAVVVCNEQINNDHLSLSLSFCPPLSLSVLHRIKGAPCTPAMASIDSPDCLKNPLLPKTPQEFRSMLELVLHKSNGGLLHDHMLEAVVGVHSKHYDNFKRGSNICNNVPRL